jgi:predicted nucleic acid-binding Zn finger protein
VTAATTAADLPQNTMATNATTPSDEGVSALDARDVRALEECMTVLPPEQSIFEVVSQSGTSYDVDAREGRCTCDDMAHNLPDGDREVCKHVSRVRFATGEKPIPATAAEELDIDPMLGEQMARSGPRVAVPDGGEIVDEFDEPRQAPADIETESVPGGHLVWERDSAGGRDLVGFSAVESWAAVRAAVAERGLGVGAIHHLEVFDAAEVGLDE